MQHSQRVLVVSIWTFLLTFSGYAVGGTEEISSESMDSTLKGAMGFVFRSPIYRGQDTDRLPIPLFLCEKDSFSPRDNWIGYQCDKDQGRNSQWLADDVFGDPIVNNDDPVKIRAVQLYQS